MLIPRPPPTQLQYHFQATPKMSTYLAALVVGEFDVTSMYSPRTSIQTSVYTMPGKAEQGKFCLSTASTCLDFLESTYGIKYPLPKSDLLAIPDFAAGAMENWGCVTYREAKILTGSGTSLAMKKGIARTVCHELAHQWFGNLTTMEWWNALFLNEGFARYMEFVAIEHIFPEWNIWDEFVQSVSELALGLDSMETSHPIECEVNHPDEISEIFDTISYAKGASVIRMLSDYMGDDVFMGGIQTYLKKFSYDNARSTDLWETLGDFCGKDLNKFMVPWTIDVGFPVIFIDDDGSCEQERFRARGRDGKKTTWPCPVTFPDGEKLVLGVGEDDKFQEKVRQLVATGEWFKVNISQAGFFRVNYSTKMWSRLSAAMVPGKLSTIDRLGLMNDAFALGKAGYVDITVPLELVKTLESVEGIDEFVIWSELSHKICDLAKLYKEEDFFPKFQELVNRLFTKQWSLLGWEEKDGESESAGSMRAAVLAAMATSGDKGIGSHALKLFNDYYDDRSKTISADLRKIVYKLAIKEDERNVAKKMIELYGETAFPEEQRNLMMTVGCVKEPAMHSEVLDWVLYSGAVRLQDIPFPLMNLGSSNEAGANACFARLKKEFSQFKARFKGPVWTNSVALMCRGVRDAEEVEAFMKEHDCDLGNAKRKLQQAIEGIRLKSDRLKRDKESLKSFF